MRKIPTLFERDPDNMARVTREVGEGCAWVLEGTGRATRKLDGMCCMFRDGALYKRREIKKAGAGQQQALVPDDFEQADETGTKLIGWLPVRMGDPADKWFLAALEYDGPQPDGTYELVGPKVQGNPERYERHQFARHGSIEVDLESRDFDGLKDFLAAQNMEGIVFHGATGLMAKIKARDFGLSRNSGQPA